ncbi:MAG TPA: DedA family protein [Usitatibacter sp.]|nr:DedA family protein [Usitatibacter sp.]
MGLVDLVLHLDVHLLQLVRDYGAWTYAVLFAIIFSETGFVVTPFLPGDSLLFVAGAIAAGGALDVHVLAVLLVAAAILGNSTNYAIGRWFGRRFFTQAGSRWLNPAHLYRAHAFYERHGGKAVVLSRFLPIVRTYIPFVAGMAQMPPARFTAYNALGAAAWAGALTYAGYFFGNIPWVRRNLTLLIVGIIVVSLVPLGVAFMRSRMAARAGS